MSFSLNATFSVLSRNDAVPGPSNIMAEEQNDTTVYIQDAIR